VQSEPNIEPEGQEIHLPLQDWYPDGHAASTGQVINMSPIMKKRKKIISGFFPYKQSFMSNFPGSLLIFSINIF